MTSLTKRPKPAILKLTYARAELLSMALFDQRYSLRRTLKLLEANPHKTRQEKFEVEETKTQLTTCSELHREVVEIERTLKE